MFISDPKILNNLFFTLGGHPRNWQDVATECFDVVEDLIQRLTHAAEIICDTSEGLREDLLDKSDILFERSRISKFNISINVSQLAYDNNNLPPLINDRFTIKTKY